MKLIDKDALVAEIEKRKKQNVLTNESAFEEDIDILSFIGTLEVKEIDFDALGILAEHLIACEAHAVTPKYKDGELDILEGLVNNKAQKGE